MSHPNPPPQLEYPYASLPSKPPVVEPIQYPAIVWQLGPTWLPLLGVVIVFLTANLAIVPLMDLFHSNHVGSVLVYGCAGIMAGEAFTLSTWLAWGGGSFLKRLVLHWAAAIGLSVAWLVGAVCCEGTSNGDVRDMFLRSTVSIAALLAASFASAQEIERGKLKSLDVEKLQLVVTVGEKDRELTLTERTRVFEATGEDLAEKLKDFKAGSEIFFQVVAQDGKEVVQGLKLAKPGDRAPGRGEQPQAATIKKLELEGKTITLTVEGKDRELVLVDQTNVLGARGETLAEKLSGFKAGTQVRFLAATRDGKDTLTAIASAERGGGDQPRGDGRPVSPDHKDFKPLTELRTGKYKDSEGGLYPDGQNVRPAAHEAAGQKLAAQVQPLDAEGKPSASGKMVLLSIGMSNASQASGGFRGVLNGFAEKNPALVFVDGAQGGMTAEVIDDPEDGGRGQQYWRVVDERLKQAGVNRAQVQATWIKQADAGPRQGFPEYAKKLQAEQKTIVQILHDRFPNAKLCYLSSRTYGGYAKTGLNPEPYAYESGFGVKWLIEEQLNDDPELNYDPAKGAVKAPWLSWGAYLWANGATKRADGFSYEASDFGNDGTHHSPAGSRKVGQLMLDFFSTDSTTKPWFVKPTN